MKQKLSIPLNSSLLITPCSSLITALDHFPHRTRSSQGAAITDMASIHDLCNPEPEEDQPYRRTDHPSSYHQGNLPHPSPYAEFNGYSESSPSQAGTHPSHHSHERPHRHHTQHYQPYPSIQSQHHPSNPDQQRHHGHPPHHYSPHNERPSYGDRHLHDPQHQSNGPYDHPMSYHEQSEEHTSSSSDRHAQDFVPTTSAEGNSGYTKHHSAKSGHAHQDTSSRRDSRPDER